MCALVTGVQTCALPIWLRRIFQRFYMPAANEFTDIERRGVWMNRERLVTRHQEARRNLAEIDAKIMEYVPDDQPFRTYRANGELKDTGKHRTERQRLGKECVSKWRIR